MSAELRELAAQNKLAEWDQAAGAALGLRITADRQTQISLLGLFLQRKGADPCVKDRFNQWRKIALDPKTEV